ncbi:MAG: diaminopimelate epimerase [Oscillospiraceae bacterium]|nr:diaminopimelate epimerase [Oscillospiraceae bacterium]
MHYSVMHGAGNSFVLIEAPRSEQDKGEDLSGLALRLCARFTVDGLIALGPADDADFAMLFYNADGSLGEMCGNGARCAARFAVEHGLAPDPERVRIRATAGLVRARRVTAERYEVRLNDPSVVDLRREAPVPGGTERCAYVELGDPGIPHAVVEVGPEAFEDLSALRERGRALRHSPAFPRGANVSFACLTGERSVRAITFERGVEDFTLACGTGCGAVALSLILSGRIPDGPVEIDMPGGRLRVTLRRTGDTATDILLTGPTAVVEEGELAP